jgi:hypothetical protein
MKANYPPTKIPARELDYAFRLVTPDKYYGSDVRDNITPLMAQVIITHEGAPDTRLLIRDSGHNPVLISVDGRDYFYGRADDDIHHGAVQLIRLVRQLNEAEPR